MTTRTWQRYEWGEDYPPIRVLLKFAEFTRTKLSDYISVDEDLPGLGVDAVPIEKVPVLNRIPASGFITSYDDELIIDWIVTTKHRHKGIFALRVSGDSMAPKIEDGDTVLLAPGLEFINNRIYAVVTSESEHTLKLVRKEGENIICIPMNPNYNPMILHESKVLRLIRVVEINKNIEHSDPTKSSQP